MKHTAILLALTGVLFLLGYAQQSQHTAVTIDPKTFDEFAGRYVLSTNPDLFLSFSREGDRFFVQAAGDVRIEIFAEASSKFFAKARSVEAIFTRDVRGQVTGLNWRQNDQDNELRKVSGDPGPDTTVVFERREEMVPMRDGVRLHTLIFTPKGLVERLPFMLNRTPYGVGAANSDSVNRSYFQLVQDGYIFVLQDIRGKYGSEGTFVMGRPPRTRGSKDADESTDAYDTIDWLIRNVPNNNGRAGIIGVSYDGWLAAVATIDAHPALKASSPQAPMTDVWIGDDFFHNGAFRQSYGYEYVKSMETSNEFTSVSFDKDAYDWYLGLGTLSKITLDTRGKWPTWNAFVSHPSYDDYWKARAAERYLKPTTVATLVVGGWWDQEDFYGALATYAALEKFDTTRHNFVVLGPWNHGGWNGFARNLGDVSFDSSTGLYFREKIQAPWFASYLKDNRRFNEPEAVTFQSGANRWIASDQWPPKEAAPRDLYLRSGKHLSFERPAGTKEQESASYVSDPSNPVPYRERPIQPTYGPGSRWYTWLVQDQRFLENRKDVLTWTSDVLEQDLTISGNVAAHLFASTTGTDADWIVKLIDVYPNDYPEDKKMAGYQLMVADEILRGRFRKGFDKPERITPHQAAEYTIDLRANNHTFKAGHKLMVQVQSTWFPLYDRNPQTFVENIFKANPSDYQTAMHRIYESARFPSRVTLPVMK